MADALPFLQKSVSITVLTVTDEKPLKQKEAGHRLAQHLSRNGFSVKENASCGGLLDEIFLRACPRVCILTCLSWGAMGIPEFANSSLVAPPRASSTI